MEETLNRDLAKITSWSKQWLVNFNPAKTEAMFFSFFNMIKPKIFFDNVQLNFVEHHKHHGVTLCQDGSWHQHISYIVSKASKILSSMKMLKFKINRESLNNIYVSNLRPHLEYASLVWDNCAQYEKETLEKI
jgi:hypothetical protein